jgi:fatty acid desaturase
LPNKNLIQRRLIVFYSMALLRFGSKFLFVSVLLSLWFDLVFLFFFFNYLFCVFPLPDGGFTDSREHKSSTNIPISWFFNFH